MSISNPYHEGELAVQRRANLSETARVSGGMVSNTIPARAFDFIKQQPMAVIGSIDARGQVWVSSIFGQPGFLQALDDHTLVIDISQPRSSVVDPLWENLDENPAVGILMIELSSRRRLRLNGRAQKVSAQRYVINLDRVYPNCPKYIQRRNWKITAVNASFDTSFIAQGEKLQEPQKTLITAADTFFVASAHLEHGVDASHRGGRPGFVQVQNDLQLLIPDFTGNSMFNTLGNFVIYPYAGLVFPDFNNGRLLQLTGQVEILWDMDEPCDTTGGTHRYWRFDITHWQESMLPMHVDWEFLEYSPFIPESNNDDN